MSLSLENLCFSYGERRVLCDVSFTAEKGELLSVLGPNGAGKSTLFRCIIGALDGYVGTITMNGVDLRTLSAREKARHIAYIPQAHRPTAGYTVLDTALMGLTRQLGTVSQPKKQHMELALSALEQLGIAQLAERDFSRLSGGERQRLGLARAFLHEAPFILLDEPTSNLDSLNEAVILKSLQEYQEDKTILLVSHRKSTMSIADTVISVENGRTS